MAQKPSRILCLRRCFWSVSIYIQIQNNYKKQPAAFGIQPDFGIGLCPMLTKYKWPCSYRYDICNRKRTLMAAYLSHSCLPTRLGHTRLSRSNTWTWTRKLSLGQILILKLIDVGLAHSGSNHSHLEVQNTEALEVGWVAFWQNMALNFTFFKLKNV